MIVATFATTALTMTTLPGAPCWWNSASLEHIFEAFKAVNNRVRDMTALNADGQDLMGKALSEQRPRIVLGDLSTETGRDGP